MKKPPKKTAKKAAKKKTRTVSKPSSKLLFKLPENWNDSKPFVLLFAEQGASEVLRKANTVFSEAVSGLGNLNLESPETTQISGGGEAGDTTF